jgi:hypothetical protein
MVSPHFPPDSSAATHRVRLLGPHLRAFGWEPTVVTIDPGDYEGKIDLDLERLVPSDLRVVRTRAWSARWTRRVGVGDLGLRAWAGLRRTCSRLLASERFEALFITIYPAYPATLGPILKRRFGVPFILDYQDPWVGAWGLSVGGGAAGRPDLKSRLSRLAGAWLEPWVVRAADAVTAVSDGTYDDLARRVPAAQAIAHATLPLGGEPHDWEAVDAIARRNPYFDPHDGQVHLCYVGTLLPAGRETLRALFAAVRQVREQDVALYQRLRLWFIGTSNQSTPGAPPLVRPIASEAGIADRVTEIPGRIPYLKALGVLSSATAILLLGSSEPHYTASKLYPALLARRPLLAIFHEASSVNVILRRSGQPARHLVTYDEHHPPSARVPAIRDALTALARMPRIELPAIDLDAVGSVSAHALAGQLAALLDQVVAQSAETGTLRRKRISALTVSAPKQ